MAVMTASSSSALKVATWSTGPKISSFISAMPETFSDRGRDEGPLLRRVEPVQHGVAGGELVDIGSNLPCAFPSMTGPTSVREVPGSPSFSSSMAP